MRYSRPYYSQRLLIFVLLCTGITSTVFAEETKEPTRVVLGSGNWGGGFSIFGRELVEVVNATSNDLKVEAISTLGSQNNLELLEAGKIDIGLVDGNIARQALEGIGRTPTKLRVLSIMYPNPGVFVVRGDSPYKTIDDLKGRTVALDVPGSGMHLLAENVLDGIGMNPERDFKIVALGNSAEGLPLLLNNTIDALWGAGVGSPDFVELANSTVGARFIVPTGAQTRQIMSRHPHLKVLAVPAGTYPGQKRQITSLGLWGQIMVRADMPEQTVFQLAQTLHQAEAALATRLKQARYTTAKVTVAQVPNDYLHLGALRYFNKIRLTQMVCGR